MLKEGHMKLSDDVVLFEYAGFSILGNLATGAVIGLDIDELNACKNAIERNNRECCLGNLPSDLIDVMHQGRFFEDEKEATFSRSAYFHVTQRCNLDCVGCYSADSKRNASSDLSFPSVEMILDKLASLGVGSLVISGGEPFLRDDLPDIVSAAKSKGIESVSIITNGTCVRKGILEKLSGLVDKIAVSFDGLSADSKSYLRGCQRFDILKKSVCAIKAEGMEAHLIATIHAFNIQDIPSYFELACSMGASVNFSLLSCPANDVHLERLIPDDDALNRLADTLMGCVGQNVSFCGLDLNGSVSAKGRCGAGLTCLSVSHDGLLYPCHMLQVDGYAIADLLRDELDDIKRQIGNSVFSGLDVDSVYGCSDCELKYLCGGGCRARSLYAYGDIRFRDPYCALAKRFYRLLGESLKNSFA